ncbi:MAG: DUF4388 domain-containing protein [Deltaproteobacteria bacterium]|nr:DUF4388 domain-containing protein [Deltaproteobacteria bacterium]
MGGVKGRLKDMSLVDIIQIFNAERKTAAIHLGSEMGYGRVYMKNGAVVHAVYREFIGAEAFYQLLAWKDGEFEVEPDAASPEKTITGSPEGLILEGLRRLDESRRGKEEQGGGHVGDMESIRLINRLLELGILEKV